MSDQVPISIVCTSIGGSLLRLSVSKSCIVHDVKRAIEQSTEGMPPPRSQRLIFYGRICLDDERLDSFIKSFDDPNLAFCFHLVFAQSTDLSVLKKSIAERENAQLLRKVEVQSSNVYQEHHNLLSQMLGERGETQSTPLNLPPSQRSVDFGPPNLPHYHQSMGSDPHDHHPCEHSAGMGPHSHTGIPRLPHPLDRPGVLDQYYPDGPLPDIEPDPNMQYISLPMNADALIRRVRLHGISRNGTPVPPRIPPPQLNQAARFSNFSVLLRIVVFMLMVGDTDNLGQMVVLGLVGLLIYAIHTGSLQAMFGMLTSRNRDIVGNISNIGSGGILRAGGGQLVDIGYFLASFILSIFPTWRPVSVGQSSSNQGEQQEPIRNRANND